MSQDHVVTDFTLLNFETYNDYLMSFLTPKDLSYGGSHYVMKKFVQLGYRSKCIPYSEIEFEKRKKVLEDIVVPKVHGVIVFGQYLKNDQDQFLNALKEREQPNSQKVVSTIIFLTCHRLDGSELLGYIDFESSCRGTSQSRKGAVNWRGVFEGRVKLTPRPSDLSFQNSSTHEVHCNDSDNYAVIYDYDHGLMFMHKGDHKIIAIGPKARRQARNAKRSIFYSELYGQVVLYDHIVRKKI